MLTEILIFVVVLCLALQYWTQNRPKNYPPGPTGIPFLGYFPFLALSGLSAYEAIKKITEKYGKISSVFFANYPLVVLSDPKDIREAFKEDTFSGRGSLRISYERSWGKKRGIIFGDGKDWQEQRRFALKNLRDFGFGKGSMETLINDEVVEVVNNFKKNANTQVFMKSNFMVPVLNSLWHIITGERYSHDDSKLKEIIRILLGKFDEVELSGPIFFMPWFTKLMPGLSGWNKFFEGLIPAMNFFQGYVDAHKKTYNDSHMRDFIDVYLKEINETTDENSGFYKDNGNKSLLIVLLDFFAAGADTTSSTLTWAFLYLTTFPEIQKQIHEEIDMVIGTDRLPSLSDRPKMHFLNAFIDETLRMSSITPLGIFHETREDVNFGGFTLPKQTLVVPAIWQVHYDEKIWGDPNNFRPQRFINDEGIYKKSENLISFSMGKRQCLGEGLARDKLFLFITGILQQLTVELDKTVPNPGLEPRSKLSILLKAKDYYVIFKERNQILTES